MTAERVLDADPENELTSPTQKTGRIRVLWIAPNLNHYKVRFLGVLADRENIDLTILAGKQKFEEGHQYIEGQHSRISRVAATKRWFAFDPRTFFRFLYVAGKNETDIVLMPAEKKLVPLLFLIFLSKIWFRFKLVTYNHRSFKSAGKTTFIDKQLTRIAFWFYDLVIFYTCGSRDWAIKNRLVTEKKCSYASNTLDTHEIWKYADRAIRSLTPPSVLFIGRLTSAKRVNDLLDYFVRLSAKFPGLELQVVGEGPEKNEFLKRMGSIQSRILYHGGIGDEKELAPFFRNANLVFVPGDSGLSVVHAFAYGKPYLTLLDEKSNHGPELEYLEDGINGLILDGDREENVLRIEQLLQNRAQYESLCEGATRTGEKLRVENWCQKIGEEFRKLLGKKAEKRESGLA